jgi:8-oxo-dGTP pyrophosphatase MutT (NUDIX family)
MLMGPQSREHLAERVRKLFGVVPSRLQVAALPWRERNGAIEIMLITSRDTGRWVLPKGWPEAREPLCEAAAREAGEEAGLRGRVSPIEAGRYFYAKALTSGEEVPCEVLVFPLKVSDVAERWKEKGQRSRRWMNGAEAQRRVAEPDLAEIIGHFCAES